MPLSTLGHDVIECGVSAPPPAPGCSCSCRAADRPDAGAAGAAAACMADSWASTSALQVAGVQGDVWQL